MPGTIKRPIGGEKKDGLEGIRVAGKQGCSSRVASGDAVYTFCREPAFLHRPVTREIAGSKPPPCFHLKSMGLKSNKESFKIQ